jgi:hypothetical protein
VSLYCPVWAQREGGAMAALISNIYVEPAISANKSILYPQFYEELKIMM